MNSKDQSLSAKELGRTAFHAGKACLPTEDKEFKAFFLSCGKRRVGAAPTGEAPMLALLKAWIACWNEKAHATATLALANNLLSDGAQDSASQTISTTTQPTPNEQSPG